MLCHVTCVTTGLLQDGNRYFQGVCGFLELPKIKKWISPNIKIPQQSSELRNDRQMGDIFPTHVLFIRMCACF